MGLAYPKTTCLLLLVVLVVLAGASPVFANPVISMELVPVVGCPGTEVTLTVHSLPQGDLRFEFSSNPGGLFDFTEMECSPEVGTLICTLIILQSACSGRYTVTVTVTVQDDSVSESASASFDVPSTCGHACPVGGCVQPVNTFALLSPWLAVIGLVGCISTIVVVAKKRR